MKTIIILFYLLTFLVYQTLAYNSKSTVFLTAYSGSQCDGNGGNKDQLPFPPQNTRYINFQNRHSFKIESNIQSSDKDFLMYYVTPCAGLNGKNPYNTVYEINKSGCINVNTGGNVQSLSTFSTWNGI